MDKSFNDQELTDIMKEIEALEEEFAGSDETEKFEAPSPATETTMEVTSVMEELAEMDEVASIPQTNIKETVLPFEPKALATEVKKGAHSAMSFKVQGEMNLELQFEIGGKTIMLDVSETGLTIHMEGGMTFSVPVSNAHSMKKAV